MRAIDADKIVYSWQIDADGQEHDGVTLKSIIDKMPTIEPERKTGKWIKDRLISTNGGTYPVYRCSECEAYYQETGYGWNFCPHCGADMRGGEQNG